MIFPSSLAFLLLEGHLATPPSLIIGSTSKGTLAYKLVVLREEILRLERGDYLRRVVIDV
jgi:hypothetical protein